MKKLFSLLTILLLMPIAIAVTCSTKVILHKLHDRDHSYQLPDNLKIRIDEETSEFSDYDPNEPSCPNLPKSAVDYNRNLIAELLKFFKRNNINEGKVNCVGYAQLCSAIHNYICKKYNIDSYTRPVVGKVKLGSIDLNSIAIKLFPKYRNFLKDHDFTFARMHGYDAYDDPVAYDVLEIDFRTIFIK